MEKKMKLRHSFPLAVVACFWLAVPFSAARAAFTPLGDVSPATDPGTWMNSTDAYIGNTASGTLTVDGGSDLLSGNSDIGYSSTATGVVNIGGSGSTWSAGFLFVGNSGSGTLSISSGGGVSSFATYVAYGSNSTGVATVDGVGSTWTTMIMPLYVGYSGSGTLSITNGGVVTDQQNNIFVGNAAGSTGAVTVDGVGSKLAFNSSNGPIYVGYGGSGTLSLRNGGNVSGACVIANNSGSTGMVTVGGSASTWTNAAFTIGAQGSGTLSIANSASITSSRGDIGSFYGGTGSVTVDGAGSVWNVTNNFFIGNIGSGTLAITNGAHVNGTGSAIGQNSSSTGIVTVDGVGSTLANSGTFYIGSGGHGSLSITNRGQISSGTASLGGSPGATGVVTVDGPGSSWTGSGALYVGYSGAGTFSVVNGAVASVNGGYLAAAYNSKGALTVDGVGSTLNDTGNLYVGSNGSGTLSITNGGSVSVASSTYVGASPTSVGVIDFGANGGTLTTQSLCASPGQLTGAGTINARGIVSDIDILFDPDHGLMRTLPFQQAGQNVTLNLDLATSPSTSGDLGAGWKGVGSLTIQGGFAVQSGSGGIAYCTGSTGTATVTGSGSTWTTGPLSVGISGNGTLLITNRGTVNSSDAFVAVTSSSRAVATVDGPGSIWNCGVVYAGDGGNGSVSVINGGSVVGDGDLGSASTGKGLVTVDGAGSTWKGNFMVGNGGGGTLSIKNHGYAGNGTDYIGGNSGSKGLVSVDGVGSKFADIFLDVGLYGGGTLSVTHGGSASTSCGINTYIAHYAGSKGLATVDGPGSTWNVSGGLIVGSLGSGTLSITNGGSVTSTSFGSFNDSSVGGYTGAKSLVIVDGAGSTWKSTTGVYVGYNGYGAASITNGGRIIGYCGIGRYAGAKGAVSIDGPGSTWSCGGSGITVGNLGSGTLSISRGGSISAAGASINSTSLLTIDVGRGSLVNISSGSGHLFTNNGTLRMIAAAYIAAGDYTPVIAGTWSGAGVYQAIGGSLNISNHVFTVSPAATGTSGSAVPLDLASTQRAIVDDNGPGGTNWEVGASFLGQSGATNVYFTATAMSDAIIGTLDSHLSPGEAVLSGWMFSASGYTVSPSNPVYLSFNIGANHPADDLEVWHYDATSGWSKYSPFDLTCNGALASFTATSFSGYAMVAVPEPGTVMLLLVGLLVLRTLVWRRRMHGR
jgi:fibronectin-binding autotransporter adhesin